MKNEVAAIRKEMGLKPGPFGDLFKVHRTTIMRWERDGDPMPGEAMLRWMRQELEAFRAKSGSSKSSAKLKRAA